MNKLTVRTSAWVSGAYVDAVMCRRRDKSENPRSL